MPSLEENIIGFDAKIVNNNVQNFNAIYEIAVIVDNDNFSECADTLESEPDLTVFSLAAMTATVNSGKVI